MLDLLPEWPAGPYAKEDGSPLIDAEGKRAVYAGIYLAALAIPLVSVSGVILAGVQKWRARRGLKRIRRASWR